MTEAKPGASARLALRCIALYQAARAGRPTACRFSTSCSAYACEAIEIHGLARGSILSLRRVARCRPLGPHGVDEVPPARAKAMA